MEDPRDQPYPLSRPQAPTTAYPITVEAQYLASLPAASPAQRPGRWAILRRTTRLLLRRTLYLLALVGRALRPVAGFAVVIVALLGVIGWLGIELWSTRPADPRVEALPPSAAVESYIKGQQSFDADMMWEAFSPAYRAAQLQKGASKATLQAQADNEKLLGLTYRHFSYIGGIRLEDGGGMYFYAVDVEVPNQHARLPFVFTADKDGQIVKITSPLNN